MARADSTGAPRPVMSIDDKTYLLAPLGRGRGFIDKTRRPDFAVSRREEQPSLQSVEGIIVKGFPDSSLGHGRRRINRNVANKGSEYRYVWKARADTRWPHGVHPPLKEEDATGELEVIRASASFKGNLWAIWEDDAGRSIKSRKFVGSSTAWTAGGTLFTSPAVDATSSSSTSGATTLTFGHTVDGDEPNMALIVAVGSVGAAPSKISYAGDANRLVKLGEDAEGTRYVSLWSLGESAGLDPGTHSIIVTLASSAIIIAGGISFSHVNQASVLSNFAAGGHSSGGEKTRTVTTTANDVVISVMMTGGNTDFSDGEGQNQLFQITAGPDRAEASYKRATGTSTAMVWTLDGATAVATDGAARVNGAIAVPLDIIAHKTNLLVLAAGHQSHSIHRSTDGATWSSPDTAITEGLLSTTITQSVDSDLGLLSEIGGEAVAALYHEDNSVITFFSSADAGDIWADEAVDIPSGNGPQGIAVMKGTDGADKLYVGTAEGLWEVDTSASTWTFNLVDPLPYHEDNCRRMVVHGGELYYGVGVSDDETFNVHRLSNQQGRQTVEPDWGIGGDGLDTELQGPIRRMVSRGDELFVCFGGGAASRNAQIFSMLPDGSWHYMGRNSTANQKIEWMAVDPQDDGTPRLHYSKRTSTTATTAHYLRYPSSHPLSGVSFQRESGLVQYPYIDWGFPFESKMILRVGGNTESLDSGTSGEYIDVKYQVDHTYTSMSDLGNFDSATERLLFPAGSANGEGLSAKNLGLELTLNINGATSDLTMKDLEIEAIINKTPTYFYNVMVDAEETSETVGDRDISVIRSDLEGLESSGAKVKVIFGDSGASYKRVVEAKYDFIIEDTDMGNAVDTKARLIPVVNLTLEDIP